MSASALLPTLGHGRWFANGRIRRAEMIQGAARFAPLVDGGLFIQGGVISLNATAVRPGVEYSDVGPSSFVWRSADGVCEVLNEIAFSGGSLEDSGEGEGTLIEVAEERYPPFSNALTADTEV